MKLYRCLTLVLALVLSTSAFSAEKKKKTVVESETIQEKTSGPSSFGSESQFALTGSIGAVDGNFVFGPGIQLEWPMMIDGSEFGVGFQTGFLYSTKSVEVAGISKVSAKTWGIPLLFHGRYIFPSNVSFLKAYFGLATGISVDRSSVTTNIFATGNGEVKSNDTTVHFVFFFKPGVTFGETQRWFAELPLGVYFTEFTILPTVGYRF